MKRVRATTSLKPEGKALLQRMADEHDLSLSSMIRLLIKEAVKARKPAHLRRVA